jgi:two-component system, LytTR family, response regulator
MDQIKCLIVDDEPHAREIIEMHLAKLEYVRVVATCENAIEALEIIRKNELDLIFLDINMPEISGLELMKIVGDDVKVIFTTAHREFALEGFELEAIDYLLKPITFEKLAKSVNKYQAVGSAKTKANTAGSTSHIFVRSDRKKVRVNLDEILYVESFSDYVKIHTSDKTIVTRMLISSLEEQLPAQQFLRIHRSTIVAIDKVNAYTNESVEIGGQLLVISRGYKEKATKILV